MGAVERKVVQLLPFATFPQMKILRQPLLMMLMRTGKLYVTLAIH